MKKLYLCGGCGQIHNNEDFDPKVDKEIQTEEKFKCGNCKHELKFGYKFCPECGRQQLWGIFG